MLFILGLLTTDSFETVLLAEAASLVLVVVVVVVVVVAVTAADLSASSLDGWVLESLLSDAVATVLLALRDVLSVSFDDLAVPSKS